MLEDNEYYTSGSFFTILKRGFRLFRKTFFVSFLVRLIFLALSLFLIFLHTKIGPYMFDKPFSYNIAMFPTNWYIGALLVLILILINFIGQCVTNCFSVLSTKGKPSLLFSLKFSFGKIPPLIVLSLIYFAFWIVLFFWSFFMGVLYYYYYTLRLIIIVIFPILLIVGWIFISPFFNNFILSFSISRRNSNDFMKKFFSRRAKNYIKILKVNSLITFIFVLFNFIFFVIISMFYNVETFLQRLIYPVIELNNLQFFKVDFVYLIILSIFLVFSSNLKIALCSSIIGLEREKEEANKDKIAPIEENLDADIN